MANFYRVGISSNKTLAHKSVAVSVGINLFPYANIKNEMDKK